MTQEANAVATTQKNEVAKTNQAFITAMFEKMRNDFLEANEGLGLDFVHMTTWLTINAKGQFVDKDNPDLNYGDSLDVIIASGEERYSLWGKKGTKEEGALIVSELTRDKANEAFRDWCENNPQSADDYDEADIQSRYVAFVVPVASLLTETPKVYILGMAPTSKIAYGQWAFSVYSGKEAARGIPKGTGINRVITRLKTVDKTNKDKENYIAIEFNAIEMFDETKHMKKQ